VNSTKVCVAYIFHLLSDDIALYYHLVIVRLFGFIGIAMWKNLLPLPNFLSQ